MKIITKDNFDTLFEIFYKTSFFGLYPDELLRWKNRVIESLKEHGYRVIVDIEKEEISITK